LNIWKIFDSDIILYELLQKYKKIGTAKKIAARFSFQPAA
jgi:hypothetical protein